MRILLEALSLPVKHLAIIGRFASPIFVLLIVGTIWGRTEDATDFSMGLLLIALVFALGFVAAATLAVVACHRVFILD